MQSISAAYDGFMELNSNLEEGTKAWFLRHHFFYFGITAGCGV
jgi:hypothetical protein